MSHTILKTMKGKLHNEPIEIKQCYQPSYNAGERVGQDIFYIINSAIRMPADSFWKQVNAGNIKIN